MIRSMVSCSTLAFDFVYERYGVRIAMERKLDHGELKKAYDRGIIHHGNTARFLGVMDKAIAGKDVTIGFIGGSITAGSLSGTPQTCYAYLVYSWWKEKFPKSRIHYQNAGVGATTSQFGVARLEEDLLCQNPDVVFAEFSVNDLDNDFFQETFEGLVRRILLYRNTPALFLINNVFYGDGHNAQRVHNQIGIYYDLPIVSLKESIYEEIGGGRINKERITPDDLHPNDLGHELVAGVIINHLENIYLEFLEQNQSACVYSIPGKPLTLNRFFKAVRNHNANITPSMFGFAADRALKTGSLDVFRGGWYAASLGDTIRFKLSGSFLAVQYRKYAVHPAPIAVAVVDGDEEHGVILDANFNETWGDCPYLQDVMTSGQKGEHILEVRIIKEAGEKVFYLACVITA